MKLKHHFSGSSLLELRKKYGTGKSGFYNNDWWLKEDFAKEKPPAGLYEIDFDTKLFNLTYDEQIKKLKKGWKFPHPAVLTEAVLEHYKKTGKNLMKNWSSRTRSVSSNCSIDLGDFGLFGLCAYNNLDDVRYGRVGVSPIRKLKNVKKLKSDKPDTGNLNDLTSRIIELEKFKEKVKKVIKI